MRNENSKRLCFIADPNKEIIYFKKSFISKANDLSSEEAQAYFSIKHKLQGYTEIIVPTLV